VEGDDADVFGYHWEDRRVAVNLFHMRGGRVLDRREFFWEDVPERADGAPQEPGQLFSALLKQLYLDQRYVPRRIYVPGEFDDREMLEEVLSEKVGTRVEIQTPQRGAKRSLVDLVGRNARQSYEQRFRVRKPAARAIQESLQEALTLPSLPKRIECFDISHIQGAETVASMVVWEDGRMNKSAYRKFLIRTVEGVDDFAAMREVIQRRYQRVQAEKGRMPSLVLVDGGLGQLHAAAQALESLAIVNQPLAAIAKREETIYVHGVEDEPVVLDRHSPVLHLVQQVRDEAHRFALTFHRKRRQMRDRSSELLAIPGIGERTSRRLLEHFGSLRAVQQADASALSAVVTRAQAKAIRSHFEKQ
jgi:excinuclease ABC subunit C